MATELLQLTAAMLKKKINPLNESGLWGYGDDFSESDVDQILAEQEDLFVSSIPERYRSRLRRIEGEKIVVDATNGQATANLGLVPAVTGTVELYLNWGQGSSYNSAAYPTAGGGERPYSTRQRIEQMQATAYTVSAETGLVTFTPTLSAGFTVFADYNHEAAYKWKAARYIVLTKAAIVVQRDFPTSADSYERVRTLLQDMAEDLKLAMNDLWGADGRFAGIDLIDKLILVEETRTPTKAAELPALGGW